MNVQATALTRTLSVTGNSEYNQEVTLELREGQELRFNLSGKCSWNAQPHDYCDDAGYFSCYPTDIMLITDGESASVDSIDGSFMWALDVIIQECLIVTDDTRISEDDDEFTGMIKTSYDISEQSKVKIINLVEQLYVNKKVA